MKKWITRQACLSVVIVLLIPCLMGCRIGNTDYVLIQKKVNKKTVFSVNDYKCSIIEAKLYLCNYKNLYGNPFGIDLWEEDTSGNLEGYVKDVAISELSRIICMDLLAEEQGVSLSGSEKELAKTTARDYFSTLSEEEIEYIGLTESKLTEFYEHYALAVKLYNTLTVGVDEEVSDDEARVINIQQIFVSTEEKKEAVAKLLEKGDPFSIVASTYSELATVERNAGRGELPQEVEDVAFELDNGKYSDAIAVEDGFYFIYCVNKYDAELTEANKGNILIQREKEQFNDVYDAFIEEAEFQFNNELWDSVVVDTGEGFQTDSFFFTYEKYFGKVETLE